MIMDQSTTTEEEPSVVRLGIIGGSSLFHAPEFAHRFHPMSVQETPYGSVQLYQGRWDTLDIIYCQRHHADGTDPKVYRQPKLINYRAIVFALHELQCRIVLGLYSVGSMRREIPVGSVVLFDDTFNPFHILHFSTDYAAHVVPALSSEALRDDIRTSLSTLTEQQQRHAFFSTGTYVQSSGPRFETKAEISFFRQFGEFIGMTGAHEAELLNELSIPLVMIGIVDNMAHGIESAVALELKDFKSAQKKNAKTMESIITLILNHLAKKQVL